MPEERDEDELRRLVDRIIAKGDELRPLIEKSRALRVRAVLLGEGPPATKAPKP